MYVNWKTKKRQSRPLLLQYLPEVESLKTSLASRTSSRTHFEVLGLEASSRRKLPCPRIEDNTIFWTVEISLENAKNLAENLRRPFFVFLKWRSPEKNFLKTFFCLKKFFQDLFFEIPWKKFLKIFFWRTLAPVSLLLGLGLDRVCPWSWLRNFFVSLASSLVTSTLLLIFANANHLLRFSVFKVIASFPFLEAYSP